MDPLLMRILLVVGLLGLTVLVGRWLRRRDGVVRSRGSVRLDAADLEAVGLDLADTRVGALLLGSATCAPCQSVKRVLGEVEVERDDFRWVYADAGQHLQLTEQHRIMRVPTLLVLAQDGRILARSSGVPRHEDLRRVLDAAPGADAVA